MNATEKLLSDVYKTILAEPNEDARKRLCDFALDYLSRIHAEMFSDDGADARREYQRAWRRKNKERVKQYNARYWKKKAGEHGC